MRISEEKKSRWLLELFGLAFLTTLLVTWYATIVVKDYTVFTDEETVPASADFFAALFGIEEEAEEEAEE